MRKIYETVVFDGSIKTFRILNLTTGTVYSMNFDTFEEADKAIKRGEVRGQCTVDAVELKDIQLLLLMNEAERKTLQSIEAKKNGV
mgnify:CR=1 FL=1